MRYPTHVKLLCECVDWMYGQMKLTCKRLKIPTPRTKYLVHKEKNFSYMCCIFLEKLIYEQKKIEDQ